MNKKSATSKDTVDKLVRGIMRKTRKHYSVEEKIRIVLAGLRGEESIAALCRREGIADSAGGGNHRLDRPIAGDALHREITLNGTIQIRLINTIAQKARFASRLVDLISMWRKGGLEANAISAFEWSL